MTEKTESVTAKHTAHAHTERDEAFAIADRILDRPNADPDDDIAVLARQFLRVAEHKANLQTAMEEIRETWVTLALLEDEWLIKNKTSSLRARLSCARQCHADAVQCGIAALAKAGAL